MTEEQSSSGSSTNRRQLRERKQRKLYAEEWEFDGEEEMEGVRGFSVAEKLESSKFAQTNVVREMKGSDFTLSYIQQYGFSIPLLFREKSGLGLRVPPKNFTIDDVRLYVGSHRILDVMDVNTQKNIRMTMEEWQKYYDNPNKNCLLNVISLEFSRTKLDNLVQSPNVVREIDWVDVVWPRQLKESQIEETNKLECMKYPKVQKYCLMSVKNCYTDFHIDFGGTSVWYHILKGSKVFWLIPPTETNLKLYEKWVLSGKQSEVFFGDAVEKCARVYLTAGNTFFIPSGWIHAVYTPTDSLVFGGNFLHSFGICKQLKTAEVEDATKVPQKFRYPFFTEMLWYVLARYVHVLLGKSHIEGELSKEKNQTHVHLTRPELLGLKGIVMYLYGLPPHKKNVPELIKDPVELIQDVRTLVEYHCKDKAELAVTGKSILIFDEIHHKSLQSPNSKYNDSVFNQTSYLNQDDSSASFSKNIEKIQNIDTFNDQSKNSSNELIQKSANYSDENSTNDKEFLTPTSSFKMLFDGNNQNLSQNNSNDTTKEINNEMHQNNDFENNCNQSNQIQSSQSVSANSQPRRRRTRCKMCEACRKSDCGECSFCLDMIKFGGPGRAKQTCMVRQCLSPMLPITAQCVYCHLDGWRKPPVSLQTKSQTLHETSSTLMECSICYEISHPDCVQKYIPNISGIINNDLPNSWECPSCCKMGKNADYKPRHFRARQKSSDIRRMSISGDISSADENRNSQDINYESSGKSEQTTSFDKNQIKESGGDGGGGGNGCSSNGVTNFNNSQLTIENVNSEHSIEKKRRKSDDGSVYSSIHENIEVNSSSNGSLRKKNNIRTQLGYQILNSSQRTIKLPQYTVRPARIHQQVTTQSSSNLALNPICLKSIFRYLSQKTLIVCSLVCKTWSDISVDPSLWKCMNCTEYKLSASLLRAIVRRQPENLILDWTQIVKKQLIWIIARLPALKSLSLQSVPIHTVFALHTCLCPPLQMLDLSFVCGLNDSAIREILSPPKDSRPGLTDSKSRLRNLRTLKIAGSDISDVALRYITQGLPSLIHLDLSSCQRITDAGVAQIGTSTSAMNTLAELNLSSCRLITELSLDYLSKCDQLVWLDLRHVPLVSTQAVIKFAAKSKHDLQVKDIKLVVKRKVVCELE